ncbi:predicted protein [Nematostella vectensis]|uniref:ubiquitinyl hydrolase 1 n=1 Tax=Nematostella vectensis TaxID=45351 RepID=A7RVS4_NEMVE|nr:predicted protein [Nematostella vectensis]|eukprot:XP_001636565.1 predicted protein [Nematostella vectensis]
MAIKCLHSQHKDNETQAKTSKMDPEQEQESEQKNGVEEQLVQLQFIKHDWFEQAKDLLTIHIYVRQLNKEVLDVGLFENELQLKFATRVPQAAPRVNFQHNILLEHQTETIIGEKICQFRGFMQQDAQEFMAFLLDGLHEDLNRVLKKPYTEEVEGAGKPDHEVANEAWRRHRSRNDSIIVDMFQGQLKSKLTCPVCKTISIKYDPFMNLSVPLPKENKLLKVVVFFKDTSRMPLKMTVKVSQDGSVEQLMAAVERKTGIRVQNMRVVEEFQGKFHKVFQRNSSLSSVTATDNIFVFQVLGVEEAEEEVYEVSIMQRVHYPAKIPLHCADCFTNQNPADPLKRCMRCYAIGYCNKKCQEKHWPTHRKVCKVKSGRHMIGLPFIVSMPASQATYTRLKDLAEEYARHSVDVRDGEDNTTKTSDPSSACETDNSSSDLMTETHPRFFIKPVNGQGEGLTGPEGTRITDQDYPIVSGKPLECEELPCESEELSSSYSCTLRECFELFTEPETLGEDDAWHCPKCKKHREATKQMSLWRLPDTLIIHLKRFSFKNILFRDKITKLVEFPVRGLDMTPFCLDKGRLGGDVYDLYAVANHVGNVNFGHYTAYGRLPPAAGHSDEIGWRYFDDRNVTVTAEERVVSKYAYVLFYQRRPTGPQTTGIPPPGISLPKTASGQTSKEHAQTAATSETHEGTPTTHSSAPPVSNGISGQASSEHAQRKDDSSNSSDDELESCRSKSADVPMSNVTLSSVDSLHDSLRDSTAGLSRSLVDVDECELD